MASDTARLAADEADGAEKFRASHSYSPCFRTFSLFCCHEQSKKGEIIVIQSSFPEDAYSGQPLAGTVKDARD